MCEKTVKRILASRVYDVAVESPLVDAAFLSNRLGNRVKIKREDLQLVYSFKLRGAYNKIVGLSAKEKECGIIAASAGNHAQGVAFAGRHLGIKTVIVMPTTTPEIKVRSVIARGADVILKGDSFNDALEHAQFLQKQDGYIFIHPYDDPDVIAGQGTIGMELIRQHSGEIDAVFIPVGGGGLLAGVAAYLKYVRPEIKVIAIEPDDAACFKAAFESGERTILSDIGLFADGVAVKQIGEEPFRVAKNLVDEVVTVSTDEICAAIKDIFEDTRAVSEPAGALSLAGLKKYVAQTGVRDQTLISILSGANVNFDRLRHVVERAEVGEGREALLAVRIPEKAGSFLNFCKVVGARQITEFNYRYSHSSDAQVFVGVKVSGEDRARLIDDMVAAGYEVTELSDNELAKLHIRHTVGGHAPQLENEVVYRFEFPERPSALSMFLEELGTRWNISLFHYRNHGAAYGRVLAAFQASRSEQADINAYLDKVGYRYWDETANPAYQLFLA